METKQKYIEQWERVIRWHERLKETSSLDAQSIPTDRFQDDIFAFFLNCYHLKDWIKHDPSAAHMKDQVEAYINSSEALSLCADLCNGLKHLTLDSSRSKQDPQFDSKIYRMAYTDNTPGLSLGYLIVTSKHSYDAFSLAGVCLMDWETFLYANQAPITP